MGDFGELFARDFTYLRAFMKNVARYPDRYALTCTTRQESWTYRALNAECNRLARAFLDWGLGPTDVVMACLFNTAEFVFCWIGTQKMDAVFSPINFRLSEGEIAAHIEDSSPKLFLYDADLKEIIQRAVRRTEHPPETLIMVGEGETPRGSLAYADFVAGKAEDDVGVCRKGPFDEILRLYTSGTTGQPKGVPLTNVNNLLRSYDVIMHFPLSPNDKVMNMTPWFHAGGVHTGPCPSLHAGAESVGLKAFSPKLVLDSVEKLRLTFLVGAPTSLELLSLAQANEPRDLSSLKGIVTMGAPLSREACLRYHELLTPNIFNGYGTTETFWNTFLRPYDLPAKAGSAGRSCTDDIVRVVKIPEDRTHAEPDDLVARDGKEEGEVIIQTLKAPYRYHNKPEDERRNYYQGWYYTKDIGCWDEAGYVTICGRRDDMIISEGENIHPAQVEAIINEYPKVADSIVVGVPDAVKGQAVAAYVVLKDASLTTRELFQFLTHHPRLALFKRPRYFKFVDQIPLTATGKKKHFLIEARAREDLEKGDLKR